VVPVHDWLLQSYPTDITDGSALRRAFNTNKAYVGLRFQLDLSARGVDFGVDTETQIHNARMLGEGARCAGYTKYGVPVIYMQYGVNFFNQPVTTLLIGGAIYHKMKSGDRQLIKDLSLIAQGARYKPGEAGVLRPKFSLRKEVSKKSKN
jgi:hypothetical protein